MEVSTGVLQELLRANQAAQACIRDELDKISRRFVALDEADLTSVPMTNAAVMRMNPFMNLDGDEPPLMRDQVAVKVTSPVDTPHLQLNLTLTQRLLEMLPQHSEPSIWTIDQRINLKHGVAHQNRVLLTRGVLRDGANLPSEGRAAAIRARLDRIRQMSTESLLLNTNNIDWNGVALTHVKAHSGSECRLQWMCNDDPRINQARKWNAIEEQALEQLVLDNDGYNWVDIARDLGTHRTAMQCCQHYKAMCTAKEVTLPWQPDEDALLQKYYTIYGDAGWSQRRTFAQCSARYYSIVAPSIRSGRWDKEEDKRLVLAHAAYGSKWSRVAQHIKGRTGMKCRERFFNEHVATAKLRRGKPFTEIEDEELVDTVRRLGEGNWARITSTLGMRTDSQYRRRYRRVMINRAKMELEWQYQNRAVVAQFSTVSDASQICPTDMNRFAEVMVKERAVDLLATRRKPGETLIAKKEKRIIVKIPKNRIEASTATRVRRRVRTKSDEVVSVDAPVKTARRAAKQARPSPPPPSTTRVRRGTKRTSVDVNDVATSSLPVAKRGRRKLIAEEDDSAPPAATRARRGKAPDPQLKHDDDDDDDDDIPVRRSRWHTRNK